MSDYAYERTLIMEQRTEIMKRLNVNRKQSLLLEQEVDGRVIRFRIRKPSTSDFEDTIPFLSAPGEQYPMVDLAGESQIPRPSSTSAGPSLAESTSAANLQMSAVRPDEANVRRMQTALALNEAILKRSKAAKLVIINLPGAPKASTSEAESNCKYDLETVKLISSLIC